MADIPLPVNDSISIGENIDSSCPNFSVSDSITIATVPLFHEPNPPWEIANIVVASSTALTYLTSAPLITDDLIVGYDSNYAWGGIASETPIRQKSVQIYCGTDLANGVLIATDNGIVNNQNQTIYSAIGEDVVGSGAGGATEFTYTLRKGSLVPGTIWIYAVIAQAPEIAEVDRGDGTFLNQYFTGTIDYVTGDLYLSFIYPYFPVRTPVPTQPDIPAPPVQAKYTYTFNPFTVIDPTRFSSAFIDYTSGYIGVEVTPQSGETVWVQYKVDSDRPYAIVYRGEAVSLLILAQIDVSVDAVKYIDLIPLVPENYQTLDTLVDYLNATGLYLGRWLTKIDDIQYLIDPYTVSDQFKEAIPSPISYTTDEPYISHLSSLLGLQLQKSDTSTITDLRRQLLQAIDWYKLKGTYLGMINSIYASNHAIQIKDMYTNNYTTFIPVDWFVADYPGENPPGLDSSYYKSPHFGLNIELDTVKTLMGGYPYLWSAVLDGSGFAEMRAYVEQNRPANTVPHYIIQMRGSTHEDGIMDTIVSSQVKTRRVYEPWQFSQQYFDNNYNPATPLLYFDNDYVPPNPQLFFDNSYEGFLTSVTSWKLGTGNKTNPPETSGWTMENIVLTSNGLGLTTTIRTYPDRTEYDIVVPATVADTFGLSELGLFLGDDTTLVIGCTFPDVDKQLNMEFRIMIILYRK